MMREWEVYGNGKGFMGWVQARSEKAAIRAARQVWGTAALIYVVRPV